MSKEETRLHILKVASALFASKGFAETSMNDIVAQTGISKGGIYWHFKSKDEIVAAIYDQYFGMQIVMLESFLDGDDSVSDRIRHLVGLMSEGLEALGQELPQPLDFYAQAIRQPQLLERLRGYFSTYEVHLAALIQRGIQAGEFPTQDATLAAHILLSSLEGLLLVNTLLVSDQQLHNRLLAAVELYLSGLRHGTQE